MSEERNKNQITRKDARGCFVESLNDAFVIGKTHFAFASYDLSKPAGQRQSSINMVATVFKALFSSLAITIKAVGLWREVSTSKVVLFII